MIFGSSIQSHLQRENILLRVTCFLILCIYYLYLSNTCRVLQSSRKKGTFSAFLLLSTVLTDTLLRRSRVLLLQHQHLSNFIVLLVTLYPINRVQFYGPQCTN
ncbi:unnamed protein product, partial [Heterobilharzia americana]